MIYFDHNATAPVMPEARQAWLHATEEFLGNPSSPHRIGARADHVLNDARERLAAILDCEPIDIAWTSGATESNNTVLHHFARTAGSDSQVWISAIEHPSVRQPAEHYFPAERRQSIPVTTEGIIDLDWLSSELAEKRPCLVAVMAANNETGVLQPWREARAICSQYEVPFFCDAVQWLGKLPAAGLGECDFVSGCAHKFGGPRGIGFIKSPAHRMKPLLFGGQQEEGRRPGTENVAAALSMLAALEAREKALASGELKPRYASRDAFERRMLKILPGARVVGGRQKRLWNTVSAMMPEASQHRWVVKLDKLGFAVSTGSACSTGKEEPSHVLSAMGLQPAEAGRVLRFSSGWETQAQDWDALAEALLKVYVDAHSVKTRTAA